MDDDEEDNFLKNLKAKETINKDDIMASVLKRKALDVKGRLHHKIASKFNIDGCTSIFLKGHKKAITDFVFNKVRPLYSSVSLTII